jgi:hypothetical protein
VNPDPDYDHTIATLGLAITIARYESDLDYRLARFALAALAVAGCQLGGFPTATIAALTLTANEFASCSRRMVALRLLRRAYARQISRV